VNKETSSHGSPSNATTDTLPTSSYHPQDYMMYQEDQHEEVVNSLPQSQHQEYVMQHDEPQGGFMNMVIIYLKTCFCEYGCGINIFFYGLLLFENVNRKNPFELHAPDPALVPEPDFINPDVASALVLIKSRPKETRALVDQLSYLIGDKYVFDVG